jgi:hypothetical protein
VTGPRAPRAGPGAARALRAGGAGRVEVALDGGGYLSLGAGGWVLLAPPRAPHGPLSLHVAGLGPLDVGAPASVAEGVLIVGEQRVGLERMRVRRRREAPAPGTWWLEQAACSPPLRPGVDALARGDLAAGVALLAGRGEGLTPAGDDVLAGYAGWLAAAGTPVAIADAAADRTTALSLAYLRCAERGELPAAAEALIAARDAPAAVRSARALSRWGATSGCALMLGMDAAARRCRARPTPVPRSAPAGPSVRR